MPSGVLYSYPVFVTVYRLRSQGRKVGPEKARAYGVQGWLVITDRRSDIPGAAPRFHARLDVVGQGEEIPSIDGPVVYKVTRAGMLIRGTESHPGHCHFRQTWFCVPGVPPEGGGGP